MRSDRPGAPSRWWGAPLVLLAIACGTGGGEPAGGEAASETPATPERGVYGQTPPAVGGVPSIVLLTPSPAPTDAGTSTGGDGVGGVDGGGEALTIDQFGLTFSPTLGIAPVGSPVVFTNSEAAVAHNVRVRAMGASTDVLNADANAGERLKVELPVAGGYDVLCDMHPGMTAFLFATTAPWTTFSDPDGSFAFDDVPPGMYTIQLWTADGGFHGEQPIEHSTGRTGIDLRPSG